MSVEAIAYLDFVAAEWNIKFKNTGSANTPIIQSILPLDANFGPAARPGLYVIQHANSSAEDIGDFRPQQSNLGADGSLSLGPFGGRSSGGGVKKSPPGALPFFNVAFPGGDGVVVGIGWTGHTAALSRSDGSPLHATGGMERTYLYLRPGEEIRSPSILLNFWVGSEITQG